MIEMHSKYDNMHTNRMFYALICINNHFFACEDCMLSDTHMHHHQHLPLLHLLTPCDFYPLVVLIERDIMLMVVVAKVVMARYVVEGIMTRSTLHVSNATNMIIILIVVWQIREGFQFYLY